MKKYLVLWCLLLSGMLFHVAGKEPPPNILIILADDMGWSDAGCYGSEISTPAIDSLAGGGMLATRCYTVPRCSPSRAALMLGVSPQMAGMGHLDRDLGRPGYRGFISRDYPTIPEILKKEKGYRTYMAGKWHLGSAEGQRPCDRGFDRYRGLLSGASGYFALDKGRLMADGNRLISNEELPRGFYMTEYITQTALENLDDAARHRGKPFFMYVAYTAPHTPLMAKKETIDRYRGNYAQGYEIVRQRRFERQKKLGIVPSSANIPENRKLPGKTDESEDLRMAVYAAQITDMDEGIGRILDKLKSTGLDRTTIVLFASDNGGTMETSPRETYSPYPGFQFRQSGYGRNWATVSNTPYKGYKISTREGGVAVPLIIRYPGYMEAGSKFHEPVHFMDIAPTLLTWAGIGIPSHMEGMALNGFLKPEPAISWDRGVVAPGRERLICCEHEKNRMVLSPKYKLVRAVGKRKWELYALDDRMETRDLAGEHPNIVKELEAAYDAWASSHQVDETLPGYWKKQAAESPGDQNGKGRETHVSQTR